VRQQERIGKDVHGPVEQDRHEHAAPGVVLERDFSVRRITDKMRVPGTDNSKDGEWTPVKIVNESGQIFRETHR
jgi:ABC-type uncharacterized transport system ATPase subunit